MKITRLFDLLENYYENYPKDKIVLAGKKDGNWITYNIVEYIDIVDSLSYALINRGLKPGSKVALISSNRPEWNFMDMAIQQVGSISVPLYPTISDSDYKYILDNADIEFVFVDTPSLVKRIMPFIEENKKIKGIVSISGVLDSTSIKDFIEEGKENQKKSDLEKRKENIHSSDLATMIYTSGTTGNPKGVMLSHKNIISQIEGITDIISEKNNIALSFLPICHAYERLLIYLYHFRGFSIYYAENLSTISSNIKEIKPTMMCCVPRVLEVIYGKIYSQGKKLHGIQRVIFFWAINLAKKYKTLGNSKFYLLKYKIAKALVLSKIRNSIGGNFEIIVSGGAALSKELSAFFNALDMPVFEGYGLSETSPVIAVSRQGKGQREAGTVGPALPGVQIRITDQEEIICKGPNIMLGYYKDPELTASVIDKDGWFHTGDKGGFTKEGLLYISGRLKNIFKTSSGKYINPFNIESYFVKSDLINNIVVLGDGQKYAAALIQPDFKHIKEYAKRHGIETKEINELIKEKKILSHYKKEVNKLNKHFADFEKIKKFKLISDEWNSQNGILTPTLKIKKRVIEEKYENEINSLF